MKTILSMIGDGTGNTSSTRVMLVLLLLFWMGMKFFNACHPSNPIVITGDDEIILGMIFGTKLFHASQEKTPPETAQPQKETSHETH